MPEKARRSPSLWIASAIGIIIFGMAAAVILVGLAPGRNSTGVKSAADVRDADLLRAGATVVSRVALPAAAGQPGRDGARKQGSGEQTAANVRTST